MSQRASIIAHTVYGVYALTTSKHLYLKNIIGKKNFISGMCLQKEGWFNTKH